MIQPLIRLACVAVVAATVIAGAAAAAPTVGVYYYPWYGPAAGGHHYQQVMRMHTTPATQPPALGTYNSRNANVIGAHIDQSHTGNISMWSLSWWGPNSYEDVTIRNHIFTHPRASELQYTVHYESTDRLGSFSNPNYSNLEPDFRYLAENVFDDPNYMRIDGRPVVFFYLSRAYLKSQPGWTALANVRSMMQNEYGYNPFIVGDHFFGSLAAGAQHLDAVTAFDVYGQAFGSRSTNVASLNRLANIYDVVQNSVDAMGVDFVPGLAPGFNDTAVRSGNAPSPRYLVDASFGPSTQGSTMSEMLDRVVLPHTDPDVLNLLMVNSFNEWHEDTQIEPTIISPATNTDDTPTGKGYTAGYYYEGYGNLYLDILREKTLPDIPGDFNRDGRVDGVDLTGPDGWQERFGDDLDGQDFLQWQRNLGYTHWQASSAYSAAVPEPGSAMLLASLVALVPLAPRRRGASRKASGL